MNGSSRILHALFPSVMLGVVGTVAMVASVLAIDHVYEVPLTTPGAFRFERPYAGFLLLGPVLVFVARTAIHRYRAPRLRMSRAVALGTMPRGARSWFAPLPSVLRTVALSLFVLALMGPQSIHAREDANVEGIDIVLVLDVSLSMEAADITPSRFVAMQQVVSEFIARRPNDRIGAVVFGREAYTLMPLTTDHEALTGVLQELRLGVADGQGTAIGNAVGTGLNRLRRSTAKSKVLILLTDGDSNAGNIAPDQAAEIAAAMRVKAYTVLMGVSNDAPRAAGVDIFGQPIYQRGGYQINPELLARIASRTGGESFDVSDRRSLERSFHAILDRLERSRIEDPGRIYGELYPAFAVPALVLLVVEALLAALVFRRWP